jgi:hypothetical protein
VQIDIFSSFQNFHFEFFIKVTLLILIGLYAAFSFMLIAKIRSLNKIVFLPDSSKAPFIQKFATVYFILVLSLFFLTLVIV